MAAQAQAVEDYLAAGGDEGLEERPLDAPIDPFADIDPDLIGADAFGVDEEDSYSGRYGTQFAERILELGRVTKVGADPPQPCYLNTPQPCYLVAVYTTSNTAASYHPLHPQPTLPCMQQHHHSTAQCFMTWLQLQLAPP
jgi:hypothetical protein